MRLQGKAGLITAAASGMGRAGAEIFAAVGQDEAQAQAGDDAGDGGGGEEEYELEFEDN